MSSNSWARAEKRISKGWLWHRLLCNLMLIMRLDFILVSWRWRSAAMSSRHEGRGEQMSVQRWRPACWLRGVVPVRLEEPGSLSRWEVAAMNKQADQRRGSLLHFTPCCCTIKGQQKQSLTPPHSPAPNLQLELTCSDDIQTNTTWEQALLCWRQRGKEEFTWNCLGDIFFCHEAAMLITSLRWITLIFFVPAFPLASNPDFSFPITQTELSSKPAGSFHSLWYNLQIKCRALM